MIEKKDVNLNIPAKSTIGFIGATGSGKTTIVDIILGLLKPQKGTLEVDEKIVTGSFIVNVNTSLNEVLATLSFAGGGTATVPDGDYDVTITFTDPGPAEYQCSYVLNINNSVCRKYTFNIPATGATVSFTGCGGGPQINQYFAGDPGVPGPAFVCSTVLPTSAQIATFTDSGGCGTP